MIDCNLGPMVLTIEEADSMGRQAREWVDAGHPRLMDQPVE